MKKIACFIISLLLVICFNSCASNSVVSESTGVIKNNKQTEEKLRYEDWKYKGFGKELPFWIDLAMNRDVTSLKKRIPEMANASSVNIMIGTGENSDQAEQTVKEMVNSFLSENSDYILYDNFWVLETEKTLDMPYVALYIYYKL